MLSLQSYVNQSRHTLRRWSLDPRIKARVRAGAWVAAGFCLSAASLGHTALPLAMGLVCALGGWSAVLACIGGCVGYGVFWGSAGTQGLLWLLLGLCTTVFPLKSYGPGLLPAVAGVVTALSGLVFQLLGWEQLSLTQYLLRTGIAAGSAWVFSEALADRVPPARWLAAFSGVLALAQIAPLPVLCLGFPVAGALMAAAPFPAVALAGLALDLAQITPVPMTGVLILCYFLRFLPRYPKWLYVTGPAGVYFLVMSLWGTWDLTPLPGLVIGGLIGPYLPFSSKPARRKGQTGMVQVRLELVAGVLSQTQELLLRMPENPVDQDGLVHAAAQKACSGCAHRNACKDRRKMASLSGDILQKPLWSAGELPIVCMKSGRFLAELHRSQEQLRAINAGRRTRQEYLAAVTQQYQFLSEYLQELSDSLMSRKTHGPSAYKPEILVFGNRPEPDNGDLCLRFPGPGNSYYVLLCDGMGTGMGAVQDSRTAGNMLRRLLTAGFPPEHALRSLNSLCALSQRAGAVTVDLARLQTDTGRATIYKWGAMPSYLVHENGADTVGAPCPPPGLSVTEHRETTHKVSLKRGQLLVLISDGAQDGETLRRCRTHRGSPGALGRSLMSHCRVTAEDDATVVIIRLLPQ